jgi:hypothetical protein
MLPLHPLPTLLLHPQTLRKKVKRLLVMLLQPRLPRRASKPVP